MSETVDTSRERVELRADRIERYAEQRKAEAGNWAPGSALYSEVLAHAALIAGDAATLRALLAERDRLAAAVAEARREGMLEAALLAENGEGLSHLGICGSIRSAAEEPRDA